MNTPGSHSPQRLSISQASPHTPRVRLSTTRGSQSPTQRVKTAGLTNRLATKMPAWLRARPCFLESTQEFEELLAMDPANLCRSPLKRTSEGQKVLEEWAQRHAYFNSIGSNALRAIIEALESREVPAGTVLFAANTVPREYMLIVQGKVRDSLNSFDIGPVNALAERYLTKALETPSELVAVTDVQALTLSFDAFESLVSKARAQQYRAVTGFLRQLPVFADWSFSKLQAFASEIDIIYLAAGDVLFNKGDLAQSVYMVVTGQIQQDLLINTKRVNRLPISKNEYQQLVTSQIYSKSIRSLGPGTLIGVTEVLSGLSRNVKAFATEPTTIYCVRRSQLIDVLSPNDRQALAVEFADSVSVPELEAKFKQKLVRQTRNFSLLVEATGQREVPVGRGLFSESPKRKANYLRAIYARHERVASRYLVQRKHYTTGRFAYS